MTLWSNTQDGCLNAVLATLVGCHPDDVPHDGPLDIERLNRWLAPKGKRLEPVWMNGSFGESYPRGQWIPLLFRSGLVNHAVLAEGNEIVHDPGFRNGWSGRLAPGDLAHAFDPEIPLGYELVKA